MKKEVVDLLAQEAEDLMSGKKPAAKVVEYTEGPDGKLVRREFYPRDSARNFEAKSDVAKLRQKLNLSQKAFASRLRISLSTLQKWERNATTPSGAAATLLELIGKKPDLMDLLAEEV